MSKRGKNNARKTDMELVKIIRCWYCGAIHKNMQALRAHLKACKKTNKKIAFGNFIEKVFWNYDNFVIDSMSLQFYRPVDPKVIEFLNSIRPRK